MLIAFIAFAARLIPSPRTIDDAFITFRYARNLLDGLGFVYNAGERVLGTTTPLYTLLMAGLALVTGWRDFPWIALLTNAAADAASCALLVRLGERLSGSRLVGLGVAALWAVAPMSVTFAIGGMETSVFILLLIVTAELYLAGRERPAAFTAALLLLTRPDGLIFIGPLMVDWLWSRTARLQRASTDERVARAMVARAITSAPAIFILTLLPWAIFATLYFGSPIPHSVTAKAQAYLIDPGSALIRLIQHYSTPFFENDLLGNFWNLAGVFVHLFLSLAGALTALRRVRRAWPLALYPWLYFIIFALANPLLFRWYLAPPLPFYFLFILTGIGQPHGLPLRIRSAWTLVPVAFFLFTSLRAWTLQPDHGPQRPAPVMAWHALELLYTEVGRDLAPRVTAQRTVIAAGDIGALGYYSNARILDTVGLISPQTVRYYPLDPGSYAMIYAVPPQLILDERPDYVVFLEIYIRNGLLRDARFQAEYALLRRIPSDIYGSDGLLIFERR